MTEETFKDITSPGALVGRLTIDDIRTAYREEFLIRRQDAETFANFSETKLAAFIRQYADPHFKGIYEQIDHNFYDRVRDMIAHNPQMAREDEEAALQFSVQLRTYSNFLQSKAFTSLFKPKRTRKTSKTTKTGADAQQPTPPTQPAERQQTEGERKHTEFERLHRNPALRQACINKYGYQCQCCGMNFAEMYGEQLGARFIEVHHLKMLSTYDESRPQDYVENLVPLCANCHAMIHHIEGSEHPLRDLRQAYRGEKRELKITKED